MLKSGYMRDRGDAGQDASLAEKRNHYDGNGLK